MEKPKQINYNIDRRRFVNLIGKTLTMSSLSYCCNSNKVVYSKTPDQVSTPSNSKRESLPKHIVKWSDFEFLGAFQPPKSNIYNITSPGLTHRWINDKLYLLGLSSIDRYVLFEPVSDEILSKTYPFPDQNKKVVYGSAMMRPYKNIHSLPQDKWADAPFSDKETPVAGFTWHQEENRLYWAHQHDYCNDNKIFPCLGVSSMPEISTSGRVLGMWKVTDGIQTSRNRFICQTGRIPKDWANKYVGGRRLLVGFGWNGYDNQSIASNGGTFGPTFGAVFHPDLGNDDNYSLVHGGITIINTHEHGSAPAFDDCPPYYNFDSTEQKPNRSKKWTHSSGHSYGVWIDLPDKHGILVPSSHPSADFLTTIAPDPLPTLRSFAVVNPNVLPNWLPGHNLQITDPEISRRIQARIVESVSGKIVTLSSDMVKEPPIGAFIFGGVSYPNGVGGYVSTANINKINIYNPEELGEAVLAKKPAQRQTVPSEYNPVTYPGIPNPRPSNTGYCIGITFVEETRRLYIQILNTHWAQGRRAAICVYKLH